MTPSATHLVLIPSYNPGTSLQRTMAGALAQWRPAAEGGVSHFRYGRDNLRLLRMFTRLLLRRALLHRA